MKVHLAFTGVLMGCATQALGETATSQNVTVAATIVQPLKLAKISDLEFGTIVRSSSGAANVVTIDASTGARVLSGSGDGVLAASDASRAAFTVAGAGGQVFSLSVPETVTLTSGASSLTVRLATSGASGTLSGRIGSLGTATIGIGGSFSLNNAQAAGIYSASFDATVIYD